MLDHKKYPSINSLPFRGKVDFPVRKIRKGAFSVSSIYFRKRKKFIAAVTLILLTFLTIQDAEAQCSMCRAVLESSEGQETAKGVNNGIIYLMAIPYILIGGLGYFIYRSFQKGKA